MYVKCINHIIDGQYDASDWLSIDQGNAKPGIRQGFRGFFDIETFDQAGSSMGSSGLRASIGDVLDKPLVNYNGFY